MNPLSRRLSLLCLLPLVACPGGDPEPAGTPVTKPAPEQPTKAPALVVPVEEPKPDVPAAASEADPDPPEVR